ncbi:MAG: polyphosphate kinase 2 family protein [Phycisphaerales bacterium]|nr:polyphosphate kinase 2 family protein [Phycisphaerales bacterium]
MASNELQLPAGKRVKLLDRNAARTPGVRDRAEAEQRLAANREKLGELQYRLWAENERAILLVLQGMDTSGKDGVVRHVLTGMNPTGLRVTSFKKPSEVEMDHDFLWRIHEAAPARGEVGVFNRSHYEDVLVVRVHGLVPRTVWSRRYAQINEFEGLLTGEGTTIVKCFLHISKDEQKQRLLDRIKDPEKNWKFNQTDVTERRHWADYMAAYEDVLGKCGTEWAPWHIIPADRKWYRNWAISEILVKTMERMNPRPPRGTFKASELFIGD